ncbi:MAG: alpha/beta fold hydrolase [Planctomycetota bacterium]|nr:alpha/beta fold hydrolase [Planctomycetota bacterium]
MGRGYFLITLFLFLFHSSPLWAQEKNDHSVSSSQIFAYDQDLPIESEMEVEEESKGWISYRVSYKSVWGHRAIASYVVPHGEETQKWPCILLLHGHPGSRKDYRRIWPTFIKNGFAVLVPDAWGHGERKRKDQTEYFGKYPYQTRNMLIQSVIDYRRGIDFLQTRPEIDTHRIGLFGASMGGILGTLLSGSDSRVNAPIIMVAGGGWKEMYASSTLPEVARARENLTKGEIALGIKAMDSIDPRHWVGNISPRPVLLINGDQDKVVPVVGNKILHAAAQEPKTILWYKGGHLPMGSERERVMAKIFSWLKEHFRPASE